ncbi:MAG: DUF3298 domain-containing protein [Mongoliibacter sp.]|uniref:DUF3298 and DUF4163 domain-containing protein n=1 Tax=Mongoliibacter sp. TaxID=2022438 RepID=UPI0012EF60E2|nr:DUF3298 and DUF4163 domain-containing protein [Mongoliibacter sp.]TVP50645.1 MAG: DUF3298 domain-containing protein [Mongoliibacter sp.]
MNRFFILIILFLSACVKNEKLVNMAFEQRSYEDKVCEESDCATVILNYPYFTDENTTASTLNEYVEQQLVMMIRYEDAVSQQTVKTASQNFFDTFLEFTQNTNFNQSWEIDINARVTFQNDKILTISFDAYSSRGGAHPNTIRQYLNIDKYKAKLLKNSELIQNEGEMLQSAEKAFREYHEVEEGFSLEDDGRFFLKNDKEFSLPLAIGLEQDELVLYYNSYEIAPYAMGPTVLRFSKNDIKNLLNKNVLDQ